MTLAPCLLHSTLHAPGDDCVLAAAEWFIAHAHLDPRQARDAYDTAVEQAILDQHLRAHRRRLPSPLLDQDDDGERQPPPQRDDEQLPTAA